MRTDLFDSTAEFLCLIARVATHCSHDGRQMLLVLMMFQCQFTDLLQVSFAIRAAAKLHGKSQCLNGRPADRRCCGQVHELVAVFRLHFEQTRLSVGRCLQLRLERRR